MSTNHAGKLMHTVKVGQKGQIVIPKEARAMFNIQPGDMLLLLADADRGIALHRLDFFDQVAEAIFQRAAEHPASSEAAQDLPFAEEVRRAADEVE